MARHYRLSSGRVRRISRSKMCMEQLRSLRTSGARWHGGGLHLNHCPYVKAITVRLVKDAETLKNEGVSLVAINSNDPVGYPEDSFANMAGFALSEGSLSLTFTTKRRK